MSSRSLNRVQLIGNLTRDPELRYTPNGTAVCTFGLATNRSWVTDAGEKREEAEFHRIVAWNKLAELCAQLLFKGRRIYVEGRLQTRQWTAQDGTPRQTTEIIIDDMIILDSRRELEGAGAPTAEAVVGGPVTAPVAAAAVTESPAEAAAEVPVEVPAPDQPGATADDTQNQTKGKATQRRKKARETQNAEETQSGGEPVKPEDIPF